MPIPIGYCIYARAATSLTSCNGDARAPGSSRSRSFSLAQLSAVLVWMSRWTMKVAALSRVTTGPPANAKGISPGASDEILEQVFRVAIELLELAAANLMRPFRIGEHGQMFIGLCG